MKILLASLLALCLGAVGVNAKPQFIYGGRPSGGGGGGGSGSACDGGANVCAVHQNGQTFITWNDLDTGSNGNNWRYWVYRSNSAINSGNYGSADLIADYVFNNNSYLVSGNPDVLGGHAYTQTNRQNSSLPRVPLTDMGDPLPYGTGLQVATAPSNGNRYYAVVAKPCPSGVCTGGSDVYIGSVGPIAETVADPRPIKIYDSFSRTIGGSFGKLVNPSGKALSFIGHASGSQGGAPGGNSRYGDYWAWFIPYTDGYNWNDGAMTPLAVLQQNNGEVEVRARDTLWNPVGTGGLETFWSGIGMTPHSYIGPSNRRYIGTANAVRRMLRWAIDHYSLDENQVFWEGSSMGAMGGGQTGMRMQNPRVAAMFLGHGMWKMYTRGSGSWAGAPSWGSWPHRATVGPTSNPLGTVPENVLLPDGSAWGGTGAYSDTPSFVQANLADDLPLLYFTANQDDSNVADPDFQWAQQKDMANAMKAAKRGYGFSWVMGNHDIGANILFNCTTTGADTQLCVPRNKLARNVAYPAFRNSSIDDDWGTGARNAYGVIDGASQGCINCGFQWTVTADSGSALGFSITNNWMGRNPTAVQQTTTTSSIAASGSGSVTVSNGAVFTSGSGYYLIGGTEIVSVTSVSGNTVNFSSRGQLGTTARSHSSGETIRRFAKVPTGPNGGPYSTMTVDVTPRRIQSFTKGKTNGQVITCDITPHGGSTTQQTPTVADGVFTLTGVTINASGATTIACS